MSAANPIPAPRQRALNLCKKDQHFCFRYVPGEESQVVQALIDTVEKDPKSFDWFDAAVLSHQLGGHLAKELRAYLPKNLT